MSRSLQILKIFLSAALMLSTKSFAADMISTDDGTDKNGVMIVAPTLALRCGISSKEPQITADCMDRLAFDYKSGKPINDEFSNYRDESKAILSEYTASYFENALKQMVEASGYKDKVNEAMCINSTDSSCMGLSNDTREEIERNNKMASSNTTIILNALRLRAQELNFYNIETILNRIVPLREVDLDNKSLAGAP